MMAILVMVLMLCSKDGLFSDIQYTHGDYVKKSAIIRVKTTASLLEEALKRVDELTEEKGRVAEENKRLKELFGIK